jgi:hypothetical protein
LTPDLLMDRHPFRVGTNGRVKSLSALDTFSRVTNLGFE